MPGDNMAKVARQYMISLPEIIALNNEAKPMALRVGQMLRLPQVS
jgi:LysM repeat protein